MKTGKGAHLLHHFSTAELFFFTAIFGGSASPTERTAWEGPIPTDPWVYGIRISTLRISHWTLQWKGEFEPVFFAVRCFGVLKIAGYICLIFYGINVSKCTSPMNPML